MLYSMDNPLGATQHGHHSKGGSDSLHTVTEASDCGALLLLGAGLTTGGMEQDTVHMAPGCLQFCLVDTTAQP